MIAASPLARVGGDAALVVFDASVARLAPGVELKAGRLHDGFSSDGHRLNGAGAVIAEQLAAGTTVGSLRSAVDPAEEVDDERVQADVARFVSELDAHRLISVEQSFVAEGLARLRSGIRSLYWLLIFSLPPAPARYPNRRYPPTTAGILRGCARAHLPTLWLGPLLAVMAVLIDLLHSSVTVAPFGGRALLVAVAFTFVYVMLMPISAAVHELAHAYAARNMGLRVRSTFVRMFIVGLSHDSGTAGENLRVALAGPAAALAFLTAIGTTMILVPVAFVVKGTAVFVCFIVAVQHVASLTPLTREGRMIWITIFGVAPRSDAGEPAASPANQGQGRR
jgi:hypothetical protein